MAGHVARMVRTRNAYNVSLKTTEDERPIGILENLGCGYDVLGIILLLGLKRAMPLDRSKDMSVRVSACTIYGFNASMPVVWKLWR